MSDYETVASNFLEVAARRAALAARAAHSDASDSLGAPREFVERTRNFAYASQVILQFAEVAANPSAAFAAVMLSDSPHEAYVDLFAQEVEYVVSSEPVVAVRSRSGPTSASDTLKIAYCRAPLAERIGLGDAVGENAWSMNSLVATQEVCDGVLLGLLLEVWLAVRSDLGSETAGRACGWLLAWWLEWSVANLAAPSAGN